MDTNNHKGHRKRMREDFEKGGFKTWQKHKVLEYLLYNVIPVADTNDIAHNLNYFVRFEPLFPTKEGFLCIREKNK
jgi:DNA repair protein RadC